VPSLEALGAGAPAAGIAREVQATLQQAQQIAADEQQRVRRAKHRDLDDQLVRKATEFKTRLASTKGLEAQDEYDAIRQEYEDFHGEITKDVTDKRLLEATRQSYLNRSQALDAYSQNYILVERRSYEKDKFEAHQEGLHESALARHRRADGSIDFDAIEETIHQRTLSIFDRANEEGWSPEVVRTRVGKMTSTTHRDVINLMTGQGDGVGASEYLKLYKDAMDGDDLRMVQNNVDVSSTKATVQSLEDQIMQEAAEKDWTRAQALEAARDRGGRVSPEARSQLERRVTTRWQQNIENAKLVDDAHLTEGIRLMDLPENRGRHPADVVPIPEWESYSPKVKRSIEKWAKPKRETDTPLWIEFELLGVEDIRKQTNQQLIMKYVSNFAQRERDKALTRIRQARENDPKFTGQLNANQYLFEKLSDAQVVDINVDDTLGSIRKDKTKGPMFRLFRRWVDEAEEDWFSRTGKAPNTLELRSIIDQVVAEKAQKVWLRRTDQTYLFGKWDWSDGDEEKAIYDILKTKEEDPAYMPFADIPQARVAEMENYIKSTFGTKVTNDKIERMYAAWRMNRRDLLIQIAAEPGTD
jgi:hypothetical protein